MRQIEPRWVHESDLQDAVVLQNDRLLLAESIRDRVPLSSRDDDAAEVSEETAVVVKGAGVLSCIRNQCQWQGNAGSERGQAHS